MTGKALIVHADDLGMTHSVDAASFKAFGSGNVTSGSVMVPCPWFVEIVDYARTHAEADLGVHLTLTSERSCYRWRPILGKDTVPTLVDADGFFHQSRADAIQRMDPAQAEAESRAQIELAYRFGIRPTHLDSHQSILYSTPALFDRLQRLGRDYALPVLLSKGPLSTKHNERCYRPAAADPVLEQLVSIEPDVSPDRWHSFYENAIRALPLGVSQITVHLGYDDDEMRAATRDRRSWGAAWRQRDFDYFASDSFAQLLDTESIRLVRWRDFGRVRAAAHI